jgi:polysaccharide pyruvyl transferase WcaK-like protein
MTRYNHLSGRDWMAKAVAMVVEVHRRVALPILLIPHVMMPAHVFPANDDYGFMKALQQRLPPDVRDRVWLYDARLDDCRQIKWVISRLRVFAGSRMHSTVAALSSGVPAFSIGYSVKARGLYQDVFGHEQWVAHVSQIAEGQLAERLSAMLKAETSIRSHLQRVIPTCRENAWKSGEALADLLRDRQRA